MFHILGLVQNGLFSQDDNVGGLCDSGDKVAVETSWQWGRPSDGIKLRLFVKLVSSYC